MRHQAGPGLALQARVVQHLASAGQLQAVGAVEPGWQEAPDRCSQQHKAGAVAGTEEGLAANDASYLRLTSLARDENGNRRYVEARMAHGNQSAERRQELVRPNTIPRQVCGGIATTG